VMILEEKVAYYTSNCSSVYCVFLDATRAFNCVRHAKLFMKLTERKLPYNVVCYLVILYRRSIVEFAGILFLFQIHVRCLMELSRMGLAVIFCFVFILMNF
jgi:hypothetical protein